MWEGISLTSAEKPGLVLLSSPLGVTTRTDNSRHTQPVSGFGAVSLYASPSSLVSARLSGRKPLVDAVECLLRIAAEPVFLMIQLQE